MCVAKTVILRSYHESPAPNNSILNLLLDLRRCFIEAPTGEFGFTNCMEYFVGLGPKHLVPKWCHLGAKSF
jgi:hypothetical protein